ncbi:5'/3'-nucleotidase SurE [Rhodospirillales bacterium]|jgi:5'-nucleotidase|nr:5'/3'-nucleotidase SurE [Rhodospirillales bacterium]
MADAGMNLKKARVLLSNDDGIHAPGLKTLEDAIRPLVGELWVVAPETEQSATSHSLTLRRPLRIRHISDHRYAVDGTPTDAVLLGVNEVMKDGPPDLILSGINRGGNLGEDVTYSGTVAAAMEGALLGIPSIALSQVYEDRHKVKWATAKTWMPKVLKQLLSAGWPKGIFMNVNFPDRTAAKVTGIEVCRQGRRKIGGELTRGVDPRGDEYFWIGPQRDEQKFLKGSDLAAVNDGAIAVTPLALDLTHSSILKTLKGKMK